MTRVPSCISSTLTRKAGWRASRPAFYFATNGSEKVGFTRLPDAGDGRPQLVGGIRGVLERNTMRYYLAFDAYLHTRVASAPERFALQLKELPHDDYIAMKRRQYLRQQSPTLIARGS